MVNGHIKRKKIIIVLTIIILMTLCVVFGVYLFLKRDGEVSFEMNDKEYFRQFVYLYETNEEYEFYSLDAYYLKDTRTYYYNGKFKIYLQMDDAWYDIDEVKYGSIGHFENSYCLSWDGLHGFENVDKEFKRAQKEGVHKTYTQEEISKFLEEAFKEKENK